MGSGSEEAALGRRRTSRANIKGTRRSKMPTKAIESHNIVRARLDRNWKEIVVQRKTREAGQAAPTTVLPRHEGKYTVARNKTTRCQ